MYHERFRPPAVRLDLSDRSKAGDVIALMTFGAAMYACLLIVAIFNRPLLRAIPSGLGGSGEPRRISVWRHHRSGLSCCRCNLPLPGSCFFGGRRLCTGSCDVRLA